jgi:hypothetical protein
MPSTKSCRQVIISPSRLYLHVPIEQLHKKTVAKRDGTGRIGSKIDSPLTLMVTDYELALKSNTG